jgi:6-pyruvoyltetrahydropterin/6-carboxytetrahydropterin synthase
LVGEKMYEIKVEATFSSAHNLRDYRGKCEHLHGHNWKIEAAFEHSELGRDGIAIDFKDAKTLLKNAIDEMDHSYLNELKYFKFRNPTSENIAKFVYDKIRKKTAGIKSVSVWENESSCATYRER